MIEMNKKYKAKIAYAKKKQGEMEAMKVKFKEFTESKDLKEVMAIVSTAGHKYSVFNRMWIAWQVSTREMKIEWVLKGYRQWLEEDKLQVQKGERAISVVAPIIKKIPAKDQFGNPIYENGEAVLVKKVVGFRQVNIFDISQTDGISKYREEKKNMEEKVYSSSVPLELDAVKEIIGAQNFYDLSVNFVADGVAGERGDYCPQTKTIRVQDNDGHTLAHELGHYLMYESGENYAVGELKAELVAFHIASNLGASFNYVYSNIWNSRLNNGSGIDFDLFAKLYEKAEKVVKKMLERAGKIAVQPEPAEAVEEVSA